MSSHRFGVIAPHPPIMVPEVGGARSDVTSASTRALEHARDMLARYAPDALVVMSPHAPALGGAFAVETAFELHGSLGQFGAPQHRRRVPGDPELAEAILRAAEDAGLPALDRAVAPHLHTGELDHGTLVPLSFLDPGAAMRLVIVSLAELDYATHTAFGASIATAASALGRNVAFIASGDCSHRLAHDGPYGYSPHGPELDAAIVERLRASDFEGLATIDPVTVSEGGECGLRSFITLGGFLGADAEARVLAYEGPWGVGYLTAVAGTAGLLDALGDTPPSGEKGGAAGRPEGELPALARRAIEAFVREGRVIDPPELTDPSLPARAGAFVSLHRGPDLRGCIGTIEPVRDTLADEVIRNAIEAATRDPRFPPMAATELDDLDISVDVLHPCERCDFTDLDPNQYGVVVTSGHRRGLLLPDLEGVDTPQMQCAIAMRKAGIGPDDDIELERFRVDRHV